MCFYDLEFFRTRSQVLGSECFYLGSCSTSAAQSGPTIEYFWPAVFADIFETYRLPVHRVVILNLSKAETIRIIHPVWAAGINEIVDIQVLEVASDIGKWDFEEMLTHSFSEVRLYAAFAQDFKHSWPNPGAYFIEHNFDPSLRGAEGGS